MKAFGSALRFLTLLPWGRSRKFDPGPMLPWFPVVGLCLGLGLALFNLLAFLFWPAPVVAVLDVVLLLALTGALHLDGIADAADGLLGTRPREQALEIMKDSRVGAMGLAAVVCVLGLKWAGLAAVLEQESGWSACLILSLVPGYARTGMLLGIKVLEYGRPGGGTGADFFSGDLGLRSFGGLLLLVVLSLSLGLQGLWLIFCFFVISGAILSYYKHRMDCITGDMLGAMCEVNEALLFLAAGMSLG